MIPDTSTFRRLGIMAERSPYPRHLVGSNRCPRSRPATKNPFISLPRSHSLSNLTASQRPVHFGIIFRQWPKEHEFMTALTQFFNQCIGKMGAFITSNGNFHRDLRLE